MPAMSALTTFTDATVPHQADLNNLSTNVDTLCRQTTGYPAARGSASPPFAKVQLNTDLSIANSVSTPIRYQSAVANVGGMWQAASPERVTVTADGWYRIESQVAFDTGAQAERIIAIAVNGTADGNITSMSSTQMSTTSGIANNQRIQAVALEHLAQGSYVTTLVYQASGAAVTIRGTASWGCWLTVIYEAPY